MVWPDSPQAFQGEVVTNEEFIFRHADGNQIMVEAGASPVYNKNNQIIAVAVVFHDITERKQAEKALRESEAQKAAILDGITTNLAFVNENLEVLWTNKTSADSINRTMDEIIGHKCHELWADPETPCDGYPTLKAFKTGKTEQIVMPMVEESLNSAEHQKLEKIHPLSAFKTELDSELLNVAGSASHVKKVLMNLVVNASEAIEGKGTVTVLTMNRYLDEPLRGYEDVRTGEYVVLAISDDGSGISPQDLDRIFEPFYTKKVMGRSGTGLGLAVVWNSMQDHDGYINVKSSEKGTVFELYFPVIREEVVDGEEKVPLEDFLGYGEKILVVDDEKRQREIACRMLTKLGYNSEAVSSGEEAIEYVKEHPVGLIVLDMVMPKGINGRETYEEIIKIRPGQKAIIASGYAKTKEVSTAQRLGVGKYIKKPYTLEKIGFAVKEELEK